MGSGRLSGVFPWTIEKENQLCELILAGTTATQAAIELGWPITRNGVIGKVFRMRARMSPEARARFKLAGNPPSEQRSRRLEAHRLREQARRDRAKAEGVRRVVANLPNQPKVSPILTDTIPIGIMELTVFTCKWPVGDERPQLFCGAPKNFLLPYCPHHARLGGKGYARVAHVQNP